MVKNYISKIMQTLLSYLLLEVSSTTRLSYTLGSHRMFFSGINCTGPLIGFRQLGAFVLLLARRYFFSSKVATVAYTAGFGLFNPLLYHIPTLVASAYWFSSNKIIRLLVPIACMALFISHPIGSNVFFYSLYWLIPVIIHFLPRHIFLEALGTTFMAHAVGSVLWIYLVPMPAEYWIGLMPIVIVERLLFASGIILTSYAMRAASSLYIILRQHFQKKLYYPQSVKI